MAKHQMKIRCGCRHPLCERAIRVTSEPGLVVRIEILEGEDSAACLLLQDKEAQELSQWLAEGTPKVKSTKKTKKEPMPWQGE